jgi:hypothetical protein
LVGVVHGGCGHGLKETKAGGVIFIVIGKALSLAGGVGINWGKRLSSIKLPGAPLDAMARQTDV